jgi:hypothetical protein
VAGTAALAGGRMGGARLHQGWGEDLIELSTGEPTGDVESIIRSRKSSMTSTNNAATQGQSKARVKGCLTTMRADLDR